MDEGAAQPMRALTLIQPWATAITHCGKRIENRTWKPPASILGQVVAIHAGKSYDSRAYDSIIGRRCHSEMAVAHLLRAACPVGAVVAVARIVGWGRHVSKRGLVSWVGTGSHPTMGNARDWYEAPHHGWVLDDVVALPDPVPCRGMQGLWTLPADVDAAVRAQVKL